MILSATILGATKALAPALLWLGGLIIVVVIAGLVVLKIRSTILSRDSGAAHQEGLLTGLRHMLDRGEITREEYDTARKSMAARAVAGARPDAAPNRDPRAGEARSRPGFDLTGAPLPDQPSQDAG